MKKVIKKVIKFLVVLVVITGLGFGGYYAYNRFFGAQSTQEAFANTTAATTVIPEIVRKTEVKEIITSSGIVYLEEEASVISESGEKIKEVLVEEGDRIEAGQVIVTYDVLDTKKSLEKKLAEAEISLENANLNLKSLTLPKTEAEIEQLKNAITSAEKSVYDNTVTLQNTQRDIAAKQQDIETAEKTIQTNQTLLSVGAITQDEYDKSLTTLSDAQAALEKLMVTLESNEMNLKTAENNLAKAERDLERADEVLTEEADQIKYQQQINSIKSAELNIKDIKDQLAAIVYETVADTSGTVIAVTAEKGKTVAIGNTLITVSDYDNLIVKADVSEYDAPKLKAGQPVSMASDGIAGVTYEGTIQKIAASATTKSTSGGTETVVAIEISVDNPDGILKPGYNLDLDIIAVDRQDVLAVSQSALLRDSATKEYYVFTVEDVNEELIARKTVVEPGLYGDMNVEIVSGLKEGDRVITSPSATTIDGMPINFDFSNFAGRGNGGGASGNGAGMGGMFNGVMPSGGMQMPSGGGGAMPGGGMRGN